MAASGTQGPHAPQRAGRTPRAGGPSHVRRALVPTFTILGLIAIWQAVVDFGVIQRFLLPSPTDVLSALVGDWALIWEHAQTTLVESIAGLLIGVAIGFVLAVLMDRFEGFYLAMQPLITLSQTVPTVAIAPLLLIWFGYGLAPKIILIVVTTFFPVSVSLVAGFRSTDPDVIDLLRTMHATDLQIFWYAKLPAAADQFFSGLKISATYAIVGAVISEWLGGQSGLGVYMTRVRKSFAYDKMFASIVVVSALSMVLMGLVEVLERVCMPWKRAERKHQ
jgi:ABC-type nitrate/sulfonate/bicarbonate transport system permease component